MNRSGTRMDTVFLVCWVVPECARVFTLRGCFGGL